MLLGIKFKRDILHGDREGMAVDRHSGRNRKLADHIFIHTQESEKKNRKWGEAINTYILPSVI